MPDKCPYCGAADMSQCVRVIMRRVTILGPLYRWMQVLISRHDCTDADVWFYPTWQHGMNHQTVKNNASWLLLLKDN